ncbi:glycosyl transferase group 1 [Thiocapsa marina 5811]|uniref:Glycosyl transferase group 1 n=1 Tax=Thiocapsa marina 5811 TaxID=768671 RepID=F9U6A3_9GAMM|nr:glycosyl transferase group 1 [Thiocapsa marina 5811]
MSRLHPKKGLTNLLLAWAQTRQAAAQQAEAWRLVIAGWDQGGHQDDLQCLADSLGIRDSVQFVGPLFDEAKALALAAADAFVLPSFSEGLPMAVLEAWAVSLPVLMTPGCNLPEGFAADAALAMAPEPESIAVALNRLFDMSAAERQAMGARGRQLVGDRFAWPRIAVQMCDVYRWVLGQGPKPDSVVID